MNHSFEPGDKVICPSFDAALKAIHERFPNLDSENNVEEYLNIIKGFIGKPLTVMHIRYDMFVVLKETSIAPSNWNYPIKMFEPYENMLNNEAVPSLFGVMKYSV